MCIPLQSIIKYPGRPCHVSLKALKGSSAWPPRMCIQYLWNCLVGHRDPSRHKTPGALDTSTLAWGQ